MGDDIFLGCPTPLKIYGTKNSYAETYANSNNINFVPIAMAGSTSANGTLKTDMWSDSNGFFNTSALSVDSLNCQIVDTGAGYGPQDISWTSSDDSIVTVKKVVSGENSAIEIPELKNNSTCYFAAMKEGYAVITASLPNGESLDYPVLVTSQKEILDCDRSYIPSVSITANGEYNNKSNIKLSFYNCAVDSDSPTISEIYNEMLNDPEYLEQVKFDIGKISITLPDGFSFSTEKSDGGDTMNLDSVTTLLPKDRKAFEIPIYYYGDSLPENYKTTACYYSVSYSFNDTPVNYKGTIYLKNQDYVPETSSGNEPDPEPEQPDPDKPYEPKPGVTVDGSNPLSAFENCYKSYLNPKNKTTSTLRSSFSDLQKYISDSAFNKIIADTEMFCTFEALSLPTNGDYDLSTVFGYDGFKASSLLNIGKKALLEFTKVEVNENFYRTKKTVTVFVQLDNTGASIGGATASWCTASWYIKLSDTDCVTGGEKAQIVYSSLDSLNDELKQIFINNTHTSGSVKDFVYWVKTAVKDYTDTAAPVLKVKVKSAESIVNLIGKLYSSVTNGNLDKFKLNSIDDVKKLFKNMYNIGLGKYKLISIFCPVDVVITDSDGNVIGSIVDNKVEITSDDVQMSVDGDKKYCRISLFDDFNVQLTGSDSGTMDYIVEEVVDDEVIRKSSFDDLELTDTISYSGVINDIILQSDDAYALKTNDGNMVAPDDNTYDFTLDEFSAVMSAVTIPETVSVMKNGEPIHNGDKAASGEILFVKAKAPAGKKLESLTVNGVPIENGNSFMMGYENVTIEVAYSDFSSQDIVTMNDCRLRIEDNVYIDFYLDFTDYDYISSNESAYIAMNLNEDIIRYSVYDARKTELGYKFTFAVPAAGLADNIIGQLYIDEEPVGKAFSSSAKECAEYALDNTDEYADDITVIKALLNYGTAAQRFFGRNTDSPANSILSENDRIVPSVSDDELSKYKCTITDNSDDQNFIGIRLSLNGKVTMKFYFKELTGRAITMQTIDGYTVPCNLGLSEDEIGYYLCLTDIGIADYGLCFNMRVGDVTFENLSVYSYLEMARSKGRTDLDEIVDSLYTFGNTYFSEKGVLRGDADHDGRLGASDCHAILRALFGGHASFNYNDADITLDGTLDTQDAKAVLEKCVKNGIPISDKPQADNGCINIISDAENVAPGQTVTFGIKADKPLDFAEFVVAARGMTLCNYTKADGYIAFSDEKYGAAISDTESGTLLTFSFIVDDNAQEISLQLVAGNGFEDIVSGNQISCRVAA